MRLLVLAFVRDYIGHWGRSPSLGEVAAGLGTNRKRVFKSVRSLVRDGLLLRTPGPRGLALPADRDTALRVLVALGWTVDLDLERVTDRGLLPRPELDYRPSGFAGDDGDDSGGE